MSDSVLETLLQLARSQTDAAEAYYLAAQETPVEFENNRLKSLQAKATEGIALRIAHRGRLGFASSTDLTRLGDLVAAAVQTAEIGAPLEYDFASEIQRQSAASTYQPTSIEARIDRGKQYVERLRGYHSDLLAGVRWRTRSETVKIATSDRAYLEKHSQTESAAVSGELVRGEDFLEIALGEATRDRAPDGDRLCDELLQKFRDAETPATIASGTYPVLFVPRAVASIFGRLFETILSGRAIAQMASPLTGKLGEKCFSDRLTLSEDPQLGTNASEFDDEGTPAQAKILVDRGIVRQFFWDRQWAARAGQSSSGNGFRSGLSRPSPQLANLCLSPGETTLAELISGMEEGLIVEQVLGAGQSNLLAGEFSVNLDLGYKVEQGNLVGRVKNTMVAGSIFEAFVDGLVLGDRPEWVGGRACVPPILCEQLSVISRH